MRTKILYPIIAHVLICIISFIAYNAFLMGPEGGILSVAISQWVNETIARVVMFCVVVIGLGITIISYFKMGRLLSFEDKHNAIFGVLSVLFINVLVFVFFAIFTKDNSLTTVEYYSKMTFNAPFFPILFTLGWCGIISVIATSFLPSIIMFLGYLYGLRE